MTQLKPFKDLEFRDAFLFAATMEDEELCRGVLERILGISIKKVEVHTEAAVMLNSDYRGIRMDVYADDEDGTVFDVEMQTTFRGNLPRRSRCYQGQMDVAALRPGSDFNELPKSFIIFICTFDPFGSGLYRYTFRPVCQENGEVLDDGTSRIFLSTAGTNDHDVMPGLIAFLRYVADASFVREVPEDPLLQKIERRISYLKRSRRLEERYMLFGEMLDEKKEEGRQEGRQEGRANMLRLIQAMSDDNKVSDIPRLTTDQVFLEEMLEHYQILSSENPN